MIPLPPATGPSGPKRSSTRRAASLRNAVLSLWALLRDRAVWVIAAVVGLSLMNVYVLVLRDAVQQGDVLRAGFAARAPSDGSVTPSAFEGSLSETALRVAATAR